MGPEEVRRYLQQHPRFLEEYVRTHVNTEQLEGWLRQKGPQTSSGRSLRHEHDRQHLVNGDGKLTLASWKSRIQSSKGRLLQELSRERTEGRHSKQSVLLQLSACVASAISADGHNFYTVDEKKKTVHHISSEKHEDCVEENCAGERDSEEESCLPQGERDAVGDDCQPMEDRETVGDDCQPMEDRETVGDDCQPMEDRETVGDDCLPVGDKETVGDDCLPMGDRETVGDNCRRADRGDTVAAYVAACQQAVRIVDLSKDSRFPGGLGCGGKLSKDLPLSVLALPVCDSNGTAVGVVEFFHVSHRPFTEEEEEVAASMMLWSDMFLAYTEMHSSLTRQKKLNDFLLAVTKSIFQDISMDTVIMKIMSFAQKLVSADRASIFLLDHDSRQLYARIFDLGSGTAAGPVVTTQQKEIRFPMDKGVAGHVATTGEILNISDAYADGRFNRDVDLQTGYRTKTILCMPIYIRGNVIGVVQMVNKKSGSFTRNDEESFETFAVYCGLALHHAQLYDKMRRSEQKYRVALEVLSYHSQATEEELNHLRALPIPEHIPSLTDYTFSPWNVESDRKPLYVLFMFRDLFSHMRYDLEDLMRFTLTVRRNYRHVPYHNWEHAFSVAHSMYTVLKTSTHRLSHLQCLALFVACLCHDLDHRGKTNSFMVKSASPLAAVYSTSTMEHHHFNQTVTILQHEGHNIFKHLTSEEYKQVLDSIRHSILATDLALFFINHARLKDVITAIGFSWDVLEHRHLLMGITMTACDLCAMFKPWDTQLDLVYVIMEEFWQQGDEEKAKGMTPMAMMDRVKQNELPQLEVGFIQGICLPCYELLSEIIPETKPMLTGVTENLKQWQQLAKAQQVLADRRCSQLAIKDKEHDANDGSSNDKADNCAPPHISDHDHKPGNVLGDSDVGVTGKERDAPHTRMEGSKVQHNVVKVKSEVEDSPSLQLPAEQKHADAHDGQRRPVFLDSRPGKDRTLDSAPGEDTQKQLDHVS